MKGIFPIGTVISVKNKDTKYIIVGVDIVKDNQKYNYMCVEYPFGFTKGGNFFYYNNDEVDDVFLLGCLNY